MSLMEVGDSVFDLVFAFTSLSRDTVSKLMSQLIDLTTCTNGM